MLPVRNSAVSYIIHNDDQRIESLYQMIYEAGVFRPYLGYKPEDTSGFIFEKIEQRDFDFLDFMSYYIFLTKNDELEQQLMLHGYGNKIIPAYRLIDLNKTASSCSMLLDWYDQLVYSGYHEAPIYQSEANMSVYGCDAGKPQLHLVGDSFIVGASISQLLHFVTEIVGQYQYLKFCFPNLKLFIVRESQNQELSRLASFLVKHMNASILTLSDWNSVNFNKIRYMYCEANPVLFSIIMPPEKHKEYPDVATQDIFAISAAKLFSEIDLPETSYGKKIFLNSFHRLTKDGREISDEDYKAIVERFVSIGYQVVDQSTLSFEEQLSIVKNATHIASFAGAPGTFATAMNPDATFIMINLNPESYFSPYGRIFRRLKRKYIYYPYRIKKLLSLMSERDYDKI